jgi:hypothetical protein
MKLPLFLGGCAFAFTALALHGDAASAAMGSWMHSDRYQYTCIPGTSQCVSYQHTWAESAGCDDDMLQSWGLPGWSGDMLCISGGDSGCAYDRWLGYLDQWSSSDPCNDTAFIDSYEGEDPGTYAENGVCHQASNRALFPSTVPWVSDLPIAMGAESYGVWHYCGTSWPWGYWYDCP